MSIYTQLELENRLDRECIATAQGIALALMHEGTISAWGQERLQKIISECELRLKNDKRLGNDVLMIRYGDVEEWK